MHKFTEAQLEQAVIELFQEQKFTYQKGDEIERNEDEVLIKSDLKQFLLKQYKKEKITVQEIESIIRKLEVLPSSDIYESNKAFMKWLSDGFLLKREDRSKKDLFIQLIDYDSTENNIFKIVNQLEITGYEKRIPDAIIYINGLPVLISEKYPIPIAEN
jgi:type I restriction enzyme R subunit